MCDVFLKTKISGNLKTRKSYNHRAFGFYFIAHPSPVGGALTSSNPLTLDIAQASLALFSLNRGFFPHACACTYFSSFSSAGSASKSVMLFSTRMLYH